MANAYYSRDGDFASATTARGSEVKAEYDLIVAGFDAVETAIEALQADVSNLSAGSPPGWESAIDTRWYVTDTSSSTSVYQGTIPNASGESLFDGYCIEFLPNNNNTGAATLNVGTLDGNVPIKKVAGAVYVDLDADDLSTLSPAKLTFLTDKWILRGLSSNGVQVGSLLPFGGSVLPDGYIEPYGQAVSRVTYADLYSVIGTTYGAGDGSSTFNLPDMRGMPFVGNDSILGSATTSEPHLPLKHGTVTAGDPTPPTRGNWILKT